MYTFILDNQPVNIRMLLVSAFVWWLRRQRLLNWRLEMHSPVVYLLAYCIFIWRNCACLMILRTGADHRHDTWYILNDVLCIMTIVQTSVGRFRVSPPLRSSTYPRPFPGHRRPSVGDRCSSSLPGVIAENNLYSVMLRISSTDCLPWTCLFNHSHPRPSPGAFQRKRPAVCWLTDHHLIHRKILEMVVHDLEADCQAKKLAIGISD